ncbi:MULTISPECIES: NAD-dependent epimerase/dehydratase family protein [unclassified Sphingomonas]|uniref:NAD-dependent epimerase/dehydratase family protein n=1 Tax=unclassified Sphingomonas TaxID=196159 RepID=UPI0006F4C191|nr:MULTISPECIES: NAD-dependent epimerase/dehydratase family protein [unclassified Sphingomonas]KQX18543.1 epimerase [Sphingomonas sp. Root1294]KQY72133.1 epimerase [Sphingomonas sp. Root50]KRB94594.1 epimerase [Sphingomonas sp. Root720]
MALILITGGAGFIGSRLALRLIAQGHAVRVVDTLSPQVHGDRPERSDLYRSIAGKVDFARASVTDRGAMAAALADVDAVVHLAAETGTGQSMYQIEHYSAVNIGGTALLLDILANARHRVKRFVVASSRSVYGEGKYLSAELGIVYPGSRSAAAMEAGDFAVHYPGAVAPLELLATDEGSKLHPSSVYGITKQVQEQMVMTVCPTIGIEPVAFRYQNVFGPGQSLTNPYTGILSIFSTLILNGQPINIFEDGEESRDFVFVDDVVRATTLGIEHPGAAGGVFNVGTGVPTSVLAVAETLGRHLGRPVDSSISGNFRLGDIRHNYACTAHIRDRLGFSPDWDFDRGIEAFARWVLQSSPVASTYEESLAEMRAKGLLK